MPQCACRRSLYFAVDLCPRVRSCSSSSSVPDSFPSSLLGALGLLPLPLPLLLLLLMAKDFLLSVCQQLQGHNSRILNCTLYSTAFHLSRSHSRFSLTIHSITSHWCNIIHPTTTTRERERERAYWYFCSSLANLSI